MRKAIVALVAVSVMALGVGACTPTYGEGGLDPGSQELVEFASTQLAFAALAPVLLVVTFIATLTFAGQQTSGFFLNPPTSPPVCC